MVSARELLANISVKNNGDFEKIIHDIDTKEYSEVSNPKLNGVSYITILDNEYPDRLRKYRPPIVLFYKGNISLLKDENALSVVVSRDTSDETFENIDMLLHGSDRTIIFGGNSLSEHYLVTAVEKPILVLPCGIDYGSDYKAIIDATLDKGGLVLSEYPFDTPPSINNFPNRSRIIEALARNTLVLECKEKSGGIIRVNFSLNLGHDVFVVPKKIADKTYFNNTLIEEGAIPCVSRVQLGG